MARQARLQSPTQYYHVMMRGNNKEKIFLTPSQKMYFLECIEAQEDEGLKDIAAYCVMDNHVHLVVKSELMDLSDSLKKINTRYAMNFNSMHERIGHVFQGRYKSEVIYDDKYLQNVIRYVHNNPVKAKIVDKPKDYKWTSYNEYTKTNKIISSSQKDFIISCYNGLNKFINFHTEADNSEYLDTKEDLEEFRYELAQRIISNYFNRNGINEINEILKHPYHIEEIIKSLLDKTNLSHRQIAKLLNVSNNMVSNINIIISKNTGDCP